MSFFKKRIINNTPAPTGPVEFIIVGLGNPGRDYQATRHNTGFICIDTLAEKHGFSVNKIKYKSLIADTMLFGHRCIVMKPQTYMNLSGQAVRECADFYKIKPENVVVIFDDINIPVGNIRIRRKGSAGGHNGIKDIIYQLNSDNFPRIKVGVGDNRKDNDLKDYVLGGFSKEDAEKISAAADDACAALEYIINGNIDEAMNKFSK